MTATIAHRQDRRWMPSVTLMAALAAVIIAVVALAFGALNNTSDATPATPAPVATQSAATQPSFTCMPRIAFSKC